jgi:hypothetical protein
MRKTSLQLVEHTQKVVQKLRTKIIQFEAGFRLSTIIKSYAHICTHIILRLTHTARHPNTEVTNGVIHVVHRTNKECYMEIKN